MFTTLCRSEHFIRAIESLKRNGWSKYTDVYIGLDYPLNDAHVQGYKEIVNYLDNNSFDEFNSFNVVKHNTNLGAGKNLDVVRDIIFNQYDRIIMAEDDIEFGPCFLEFMDKALEKFENDFDVIGVSGYSYPVEWKKDYKATAMKQNFCASTWGVGFWKNKYENIYQNLKSGMLIDEFEHISSKKKLMIDAVWCDYVNGVMRVNPEEGLLMCVTDIAMRIYLCVADKYFISPIVSKTKNWGFDGSGLYCQRIDSDIKGRFADDFNYSEQEIDASESIDIELNSMNYLEDNRDILNKFDRRSKKVMFKSEIKWLVYALLGSNQYRKIIKYLRGGVNQSRYCIFNKIYCYCIWKQYISAVANRNVGAAA